jgi:hypothetical protein
MTIRISKIDDSTFEVTVEGRTTTSHRVTVTDEYLEKLTGGRSDAQDLIRRSFEFLLDRESNTSILARFDLPAIQRYFPEYESTMRANFSA